MPILGGQIVVIATATRPGIAAFDATNFTITAGVVDTIQDIDTTATVEFSHVHVGEYDQMTVGGAAIHAHLAVNSHEAAPAIVEVHSHSDDASGSIVYFAKSRGSAASPTIVSNGDDLGAIWFTGFNGDDQSPGGVLIFEVDGTPGDNDLPTKFRIALSADGSENPTDRLAGRANGAIEFSGDAGTSGEVLTSAGTGGPPTWDAPATPAAITVANEASDGSCFPLFVTAATGSLQPKTNTGLIFNSTTGSLYAAAMTIGTLGGVLKGTAGVVSAGTVDISSETNLAVTAPIVLTGDTLSLNQAATYGWTGAHTWGVDGTGVDLIAYGENSGDYLHWDQDGGTSSAGRLTLQGSSELVVDGCMAVGASGIIGGVSTFALIHGKTTETPGFLQNATGIEFDLTCHNAGIGGGAVGMELAVRTSGAFTTLGGAIVGNFCHAYANHTSSVSPTVLAAFAGDITVGGGGTTTHAAIYEALPTSGSGHTITNFYFFYAPNDPSGATNNWNIWLKGGNSRFGDDNARTYWGTANDAYIAFDGSNLVATVAAVTSSAQFVLADCGIVVNEGGGDKDTRIEGDTLTHMLFLDASAATENIALLAGSAPNWQAMDGGLFIANASTVPTGNPSGGGFLYVEGGALKYRGSSGTITTLGAA